MDRRSLLSCSDFRVQCDSSSRPYSVVSCLRITMYRGQDCHFLYLSLGICFERHLTAPVCIILKMYLVGSTIRGLHIESMDISIIYVPDTGFIHRSVHLDMVCHKQREK